MKRDTEYDAAQHNNTQRKAVLLCWVPFMQSVIYCLVLLMLSITHEPFMSSVILQNVVMQKYHDALAKFQLMNISE